MGRKTKEGSGRAAVQSPFAKRFRMQKKNNSKIFWVTLLLQICGMPLSAVCHAFENTANAGSDNNFTYEMRSFYDLIYRFSLLMLLAAVLSGVLTALKNFRCLHKREETDINLSLPLNRKQMFLADYFSGLFTYVMPYIIVLIPVLLTIPIWYYPLNHLPFPSGVLRYSYPDCILGSPFNVAVIGLYILLAMVFLYSFTVLIAVCCGTVFDTVTYLVLSNAAVIMLAVSLGSFIRSCIPDALIPYYCYYNEHLAPDYLTFQILTPLGAIYHIIQFAYMCSQGSQKEEVIWIIGCILVSALCFFAAYRIFSRRKAEDTGKTIIVPALFYTVSACLTGAAVFLFCKPYVLHQHLLSPDTLIPMAAAVFTAIAVYFIMLSLKERSRKIRKPLKKLAFPASILACLLVFYAISIKTCGFGRIYYVPDAGDIESAEVIFPVFTKEYTDAKDLEDVTKLHRALNEDLRAWVKDETLDERYHNSFPTAYTLSSAYDALYTTDPAKYEHIWIRYHLKSEKYYETDSYTPYTTDYANSDIFKTTAEKIRSDMKTAGKEFYDEINGTPFRVLCCKTDFIEKLHEKRLHSFITDSDVYPLQYEVKNYDKEMLDEIISKSYWPDYYGTEDCYVICIMTDEADSRSYQLFLPAEYSDLYEKFLQNSETEMIKWYRHKQGSTELMRELYE